LTTVEPRTPNADPVIGSLLAANDRERDLIRVLYRSSPHGIMRSKLMKLVGIEFTILNGGVKPHSAYVEFCNLCLRVHEIISRHGWQLNRSGGYIFDEIWISKQADSSVLN
jgi:hypothetical protein